MKPAKEYFQALVDKKRSPLFVAFLGDLKRNDPFVTTFSALAKSAEEDLATKRPQVKQDELAGWVKSVKLSLRGKSESAGLTPQEAAWYNCDLRTELHAIETAINLIVSVRESWLKTALLALGLLDSCAQVLDVRAEAVWIDQLKQAAASQKSLLNAERLVACDKTTLAELKAFAQNYKQSSTLKFTVAGLTEEQISNVQAIDFQVDQIISAEKQKADTDVLFRLFQLMLQQVSNREWPKKELDRRAFMANFLIDLYSDLKLEVDNLADAQRGKNVIVERERQTSGGLRQELQQVRATFAEQLETARAQLASAAFEPNFPDDASYASMGTYKTAATSATMTAADVRTLRMLSSQAAADILIKELCEFPGLPACAQKAIPIFQNWLSRNQASTFFTVVKKHFTEFLTTRPPDHRWYLRDVLGKDESVPLEFKRLMAPIQLLDANFKPNQDQTALYGAKVCVLFMVASGSYLELRPPEQICGSLRRSRRTVPSQAPAAVAASAAPRLAVVTQPAQLASQLVAQSDEQAKTPPRENPPHGLSTVKPESASKRVRQTSGADAAQVDHGARSAASVATLLARESVVMTTTPRGRAQMAHLSTGLTPGVRTMELRSEMGTP